MGFNWILLFEAYRHTSVSLATLSYYFAPVLVMFVCPILFREKPTSWQIACSVLSTAGLVLVIGVGSAGSGDMVGILFGLGAASLYASVVLLNKRAKRVSGLDRTMGQLAAAILVMFPYVLFTEGFHIASLNAYAVINLLTVGLIHTGLAYCLYFSAVSVLRGQEGAILSYVDPLVAVLISVFVLGEPILPVQLLGGAMILGFALLNDIKSNSKKAPAGGAARSEELL